MKQKPVRLTPVYVWGGILGGMGQMGGQTPEAHAKDLKTLIQHMAGRITDQEAEIKTLRAQPKRRKSAR